MNKSVKKKHLNNKIKYIILLLLIVINCLFFASILGRYALKKTKIFWGKSKEFYFYSDKLDEINSKYQIEGWSGVDDYIITIKINSYENNLLNASYDIYYDISYNSSDNVICQLNKSNGVIKANTNMDYFTLTITPNTQLNTGDIAYINITAKASQPYEKEIKGRFVLVVGKEKLTYKIEDSAGSPFLNVSITNTLSYYNVQEAFDAYSVGDRISRDVYLNLTDDNKDKCYSSIVTIDFDPNEVLLDMTSESYENAIQIFQVVKDNYTYINSVSFKMEALSSKNVRLYKVDTTKDYTYPNNNNLPIVTLTSI